MKKNRVISIILGLSLLGSHGGAVLANNDIYVDLEPHKIMDEEQRSYYISLTGKVTGIHTAQNGLKHLIMAGEGDSEFHFVITNDTYIAEDAKLEIGAELTGFYEADAMMIMIYPPQYAVKAITGKNEGFVKADLFDDELVSRDKTLKLNVDENTQIIDADGGKFEGRIKGRKLLVYYSQSTKSIPAIATPSKIVVLEKKEYHIFNPGGITIFPIVVENKVLENAAAIDIDGVIYVPIRAVSEALSKKVTWNEADKSVMIDDNVKLTIGSCEYLAGNETITLNNVPIIKGDRTYVPLNFFSDVLKLNNAYAFEGQVEINNFEKMN